MQTLTARTILLTSFAMCAFAANSLLCRLALGSGGIDPSGFTAIRVLSGAIVLWLLARGWNSFPTWSRDGVLSALSLFAYAVCFSFAYLKLTAGTGALILFGFVQITMIASALSAGERPPRLQWIGIALAVAGLIALVAPGLSAPPLMGFLLMAVSGVAWGVYSLRGRGSIDPLRSNARNFVLASLLALVLALLDRGSLRLSGTGVFYAVASGGLTSAIGYAIWYAALRGLSSTQAAICQLTVPVLAALGGVLWLDESIGVRFVGASLLILGGVALTFVRRSAVVARS